MNGDEERLPDSTAFGDIPTLGAPLAATRGTRVLAPEHFFGSYRLIRELGRGRFWGGMGGGEHDHAAPRSSEGFDTSPRRSFQHLQEYICCRTSNGNYRAA